MDGQSAVGTAGCAIRKEEAAMDTYLRSQGLYRKKIAKDGSCLFRAVAEKVLRSQACHLEIRKSCISYLRENKDQYEAFIEGSFEDYLKRLENPQEWVGQVEISALSLMFKRDFVIYQEPNIPPAYVTENNFSEKILLCFSNGNHYDIIYPIGFEENAAVCQSLIYELLYDKVLGVNVTKQMLKSDICDLNAEEELFDSGGSESDLEDEVASGKNFADMNGFKSHKDKQKKNGNLIVSQNVLRSLNPLVYRNVEYEVWLKSKKDQQKLDFSIAAGMQYSVGDKCKVRLQPGGKFFNAHIQEVGAENGPVVVFVEELGMKHTVQLKNLKPIPLTINSSDGWNTVAGKRIKKTSTSGLNVQTAVERDYRGQKGPIKVPKPQAAPPRLQQAAVSKQQGFSSHPQDHATLGENKGRSRTPPKVPGRKLERERGDDYSKRESIHFGLTPEERREKQVIEESKSLYEMQSRDEDAFPALCTALLDQTTEASSVKKTPHINTEKSTRRKSDGEDQRDKASKLIQPAKVKDVKAAEEETKDIATSGVDDLHEVHVLPDPSEHQTPTTVPSVPIIAPAWSGIQAQIPASPGLGPDSSMLQPQVTSAPFTPLPVSMPAVNQPLLPLPQTLSAYQDPLYPGFPFNEKGETTVAPPYSFCKEGSDLPDDKSILRFFFNLGVKAYTCPMWPPHSYLYPLHQAYLNMCRMYPNIPLYPQSHWVQDTSVNQTEVNPSLLVHQIEMSMESQCSQGAALTPLVQSSAEQIAHQTGSAVNNQAQLPSNDFEVALAGKSVFPQATFGQGSYMGTVPIAPPFFPRFWYGYPYQGYLDNPAVRPNVFMAPQDSDTSESLLTGVDVGNNSSFQGAIKQSLDSVSECKLDEPLLLVDATSSDSGSNTPSVKKDEQLLTSNAEQVEVEKHNFAVKDKQAPPGIFMQTSDIECATSECKDSAEKEIDLVSSETLQPNPAEECTLQTKEESSEDEQEVSSMLSSGRSKNYYSQSFGVRRPRNRFYQTNRGGYQPARNEDGWRGPRGREDSYQRNFRGRPNRRRPMGDMYRGHHD